MILMGAGLALCAWLLVSGLRSGVIRACGGSYSRSGNPVWFWIVAAMYAGLILFVGTLMVRMTLMTFQVRQPTYLQKA